MALIPINFEDFTPGSVTPNGSYESGTNLHLGSKTSPFIEVKKDVTYTIEINYILDRLKNVSNPWSWSRFYAYDENLNPLFAILNYTEALSTKTFGTIYKVSGNVKYIRFCISHIAHDGVLVNINSDEPEPELELEENIIMRINYNGNLQIFNKSFIQGDTYSFNKNFIKVPNLFDKNNSLNDNCILSIRESGLFLKGEILGRRK